MNSSEPLNNKGKLGSHRYDWQAGNETLSRLDNVAYIRYASVYRNFAEASDFGDFVEKSVMTDHPYI